MADVQFTDNSVEITDAIETACIAWLNECAGELQSAVVKNQKRHNDTGQTAASWSYTVDEGKMIATVGSSMENAIWEEFGTGQYALNGNGRKTPWVYKDAKGKWHKTIGKKPRRHLYRAMTENKNKIQKYLEEKLKGLG